MEMKEFRKITIEELEMILKNHKLWLDTHGAEGEQACLSYMDLTGVNLENAYLHRANLIGTNLQGANLENTGLACVDFTGANISHANMSYANLRYAIMDGADLSGANMRYSRFIYASLANADMSMSDLQGAIFTAADLRGANLTCSDMSCADLEGANLTNADLKDANLNHADLYNANLTGVKNLPDVSMACPATGSFIGWKRADNNFIVKLEIPTDAKRSSAIGSKKCRCNKAQVLAIENIDGTPAEVTSVRSWYETGFIYTLGETVEEELFDENRFIECSTGIHFFMTREEAVQYLRKQIMTREEAVQYFRKQILVQYFRKHILISGVKVIRASLT